MIRIGMLITSVVLATASSAWAQGITSAEIDRALRYPATEAYDGAPFSHRYNYATGAFIYLNGISGRTMGALDYYDRLARAHKFGYPEPPCPFPPAAPVIVGRSEVHGSPYPLAPAWTPVQIAPAQPLVVPPGQEPNLVPPGAEVLPAPQPAPPRPRVGFGFGGYFSR